MAGPLERGMTEAFGIDVVLWATDIPALARFLEGAAGISIAAPNVGSNAAIDDLKSPDTNPARILFPEAKPDGTGAIKDTPMAGTTAVLVQTGPSQHGSDLVTKTCQHEYKAPFA